MVEGKKEGDGRIGHAQGKREALFDCMWGWLGGDEGMVGRGPELSSVGLLLLQAIFVCVCVYVLGGEARERQREREKERESDEEI